MKIKVLRGDFQKYCFSGFDAAYFGSAFPRKIAKIPEACTLHSMRRLRREHCGLAGSLGLEVWRERRLDKTAS
jgi:hypothetical protein